MVNRTEKLMKARMLPIAAAVMLASSAAANAAVITFEEFPHEIGNPAPSIQNAYSALGITWVLTDDGIIRGGNSNGNPGAWGLEGTNGPQFLSFNGSSYGGEMLFDGIALNVGFDVSRSDGSSAGDTFSIDAFLNGILVEEIDIVFSDINTWSTISLTQAVDQVVFLSNGSTFHPYGMDNLSFNLTAVPEPATLVLFGLGLVGLGFSARFRTTS